MSSSVSIPLVQSRRWLRSVDLQTIECRGFFTELPTDSGPKLLGFAHLWPNCSRHLPGRWDGARRMKSHLSWLMVIGINTCTLQRKVNRRTNRNGTVNSIWTFLLRHYRTFLFSASYCCTLLASYHHLAVSVRLSVTLCIVTHMVGVGVMTVVFLPDNGPHLYRTSYVVRSAVIATAELLVCILVFLQSISVSLETKLAVLEMFFSSMLHVHRESKKRRHYTLVHIFAKYWPIFIIISPTHSVGNLQ